jgi:predicted glycoside hydrolase/deacetylase ChbG (UPF0249 family)
MNINERKAQWEAFCKAFLGLPEYIDTKQTKDYQ